MMCLFFHTFKHLEHSRFDSLREAESIWSQSLCSGIEYYNYLHRQSWTLEYRFVSIASSSRTRWWCWWCFAGHFFAPLSCRTFVAVGFVLDEFGAKAWSWCHSLQCFYQHVCRCGTMAYCFESLKTCLWGNLASCLDSGFLRSPNLMKWWWTWNLYLAILQHKAFWSILTYSTRNQIMNMISYYIVGESDPTSTYLLVDFVFVTGEDFIFKHIIYIYRSILYILYIIYKPPSMFPCLFLFFQYGWGKDDGRHWLQCSNHCLRSQSSLGACIVASVVDRCLYTHLHNDSYFYRWDDHA